MTASLPSPAPLAAFATFGERVRAYVAEAGELRATEVATPEPGPGEVAVIVMAAGVAHPAMPRPPGRAIAGSDAAGVVWKIGPGPTRWKVGDEVVLHQSVVCGHCAACTGFDSAPCENRRLWGVETPHGAYAEVTIAQTQQLVRKPKQLTWEQAASYGLAYFTAYRALVDRAKVRPGEGVLVWGGGGSLGVFAVQLANLLGARVVAITSSADRGELAVRLGAIASIDRREFSALSWVPNESASHAKAREKDTAALSRAVADVLGKASPDVVFDSIGRATMPASTRLVAHGGRIALAGAASGTSCAIDLASVWLREVTIVGAHFATAEACQRANELVVQGKIDPALGETFAFDRLPEAIAKKNENRHAGTLAVLVCAPRPGLKTLSEALG